MHASEFINSLYECNMKNNIRGVVQSVMYFLAQLAHLIPLVVNNLITSASRVNRCSSCTIGAISFIALASSIKYSTLQPLGPAEFSICQAIDEEGAGPRYSGLFSVAM